MAETKVTGNESKVISAFRLYGRSSATGSLLNNTWHGCKWYGVTYDEGGDTDAGNDYFTAPIAGFYWFKAMWRIETLTGGYRHLLGLWDYGNTAEYTRLVDGVYGGDNTPHWIDGSAVLRLDAGDTVHVRTYHSIGSTRTYYSADDNADTIYFQGILIGGYN